MGNHVAQPIDCRIPVAALSLPTACLSGGAIVSCTGPAAFASAGPPGAMTLRVTGSTCSSLGGVPASLDPCAVGGLPAVCAAALGVDPADMTTRQYVVYNNTDSAPPAWWPAKGYYREFTCTGASCATAANGPAVIGQPAEPGCPANTPSTRGLVPCD